MKVKFAQAVFAENCECCGAVHVVLERDGKAFAVAIPATVEDAEELAAGMQKAVAIMRKAGGKPHVH